MNELRNPIVIIGAGMAGLLAALFAKKRQPRADVVVVERSGEAGGYFREVELNGFGSCDRAMRLLYETGIPEFDDILHGLLPEEEWHVLPDNVKDVVGIYWRGGLQTHTPYLDLRRLPADTRRTCECEILDHVRGNGHRANGDPNASAHLARRFGPTTAGNLERVLQKLYGMPATELDVSATHQPTMDRVVLYDEEAMEPVLQNDALRAVIAWPDQLTLPIKRRPPQSGLYPRRFGMNRVIESTLDQARQRGVRVLFHRAVASLETEQNRVSAIHLDDGSVVRDPHLLVCANGLPAALNLLRTNGEPPVAAPPAPRSWMVFLRTRTQPAMDGLYHFWCFDEAFDTFRVTNYASYCPAARTAAGSPLCVELWSPDTDGNDAMARAKRELRALNILDETSITASAALPAPNLHALCTVEHARQFRAMRMSLRERSPRNMLTVGPFTEEGVMLLYEVCRSMHRLLAERL